MGKPIFLNNSEDKLRLIHDVVADYIHNVDKTAVDSMEEIIDIFGDADWFLGKETNDG